MNGQRTYPYSANVGELFQMPVQRDMKRVIGSIEDIGDWTHDLTAGSWTPHTLP